MKVKLIVDREPDFFAVEIIGFPGIIQNHHH